MRINSNRGYDIGKPVITSKVSDLSDQVIDGYNGFLFLPEISEQLQTKTSENKENGIKW